jgi:dienelactone hydrolase
MDKNKVWIFLFLVVFWLAACSNNPTSQGETAAGSTAATIPPSATPVTVKIPEKSPSPSPEPVPPATATAGKLPTRVLPTTAPPTDTPVLTPTATEPHPLSIEYLRVQDYPADELVIEEVLKPGMNYNRYIVSYLSEGLKINALLTVPFGEPPQSGWPAIVFNHGYIPPDQYRTTERYVDYVDDIALHGYIVLRPDYRGHAFSEGIARGAYGAPDYTIDVLNALAALKAYQDVDPNRIGMWGHSMGGYITLRSMVTTDDIKAGVIWAGVVVSYQDLIERWRRPASSSDPAIPSSYRRWRSSLYEAYGAPDENPDFWDSISANAFLEDLSGPVQLHHAADDKEVPVGFSKILEKEILEAGGIVEFYQYKDDNHNISENFGDAMFRTLQFFDKYVKGEQGE